MHINKLELVRKMKHKMSVKEFMEETKKDRIDYKDFYSSLAEELQKINREYEFFITIDDFKQAKADKKSKLAGLPFSVKDNICAKGLRTTAGSKILSTYIPPFDATAVADLKKVGAILIGKTAQDEFGFGTFSTNCAFGIPKNPFDKSRSCGGSSGGAAGLTSMLKMPHIALAESTGGSISCPAAFCGVVGLTPTYGRVSRYGLIDYANSLDKIGLIGKSTEDIAAVFSIIARHDEKDSTSLNKKTENYERYLHKSVKGMKIAVPVSLIKGIDRGVEGKFWNAIKTLEKLGVEYKEIDFKYKELLIPTYYILAMAEASTNLAKYCGMRYGSSLKVEGHYTDYFSKVRESFFGKEAKRRIILGTFARMAGYRDQYYIKAMKARTLIIREYKTIFNKTDAICMPTMPMIAPKFEEIEKMTPLQIYNMDILTVGPNLASIPHISVPCGKIKEMPVGLHIIGDYLQEGKILTLADAFEKEVRI